MKLFKKKDNNKINKKKYNYRVTICDPLGQSPREVDSFGAMKTRDNDGVVLLTNKDKGFSEVFPLDNDFTANKTAEEINKEIKTLKDKAVKPGENKLNKESKLRELYKLKKYIDYPNGSFLKIDKDGMPHITYIRYRTSFIPLKWNLEFSTIHTPVEPLIKNVLTAQKEKQQKYKQQQGSALTFGMAIMFILLLVWTGGLAYSTYHWFSEVDDSKVAEFQRRIDIAPIICAETYSEAGENFVTASEYAVNITKTLQEDLNPNPNINVGTVNIK